MPRGRRTGYTIAAAAFFAFACASQSSPETQRQGRDDSPLVDVATLDDSIVIDIRYATPHNFTGVVLYPVGRCLLRRAVAERLVRVQQDLRRQGLRVKVWDCYRPFSVQKEFWSLQPDERYVAKPVSKDGKPIAGSKHNRGAAVDLTLIGANGTELDMPSRYDDFSERAHRDYRASSPQARRNMETLERAMVAEGFEPLPTEWWHFDGPGWQEFEILDVPLATP